MEDNAEWSRVEVSIEYIYPTDEPVTPVQGRINTKLGLMLLPRQGPIFFSAFKTDQVPCDATTLY